MQFEKPPDLSAIPRERWSEAMRPLGLNTRFQAAMKLPWDSEEREAAVNLLGDLALEDCDRPRPEPPPLVPAAPAAASPLRSRQVNIKISPREHAALAAAAADFGLRPSQLARQLVVRGVRQITAPDAPP